MITNSNAAHTPVRPVNDCTDMPMDMHRDLCIRASTHTLHARASVRTQPEIKRSVPLFVHYACT